MTSAETLPIAATILRLTAGGFMLPHGLQKLGFIGGDRAFETQSFDSIGLKPGRFWSAFAGVAQLTLGLLLVVGLVTPLAGAGTAAFMLTAALVGVRKNGWYWHDHGMEFAVFWALAAISAALLGPGPWSVDALLAAH